MAFLDLQRSFRPGPAQAGQRKGVAALTDIVRQLNWSARTEARVVLLVEIALTIAAAIVVGRLFWSLLAPLEGPTLGAVALRAPVAEAVAATGPGDPFRAAGAVGPVELGEGPPLEDVAETSLRLTLHGTWTDEFGGSAVIATPNGLQKRYKVGELIVPDTTLDRVFRDQVTILRGGVRESLRMLNRQDTGAIPPAPLQGQSQSADVATDELARRTAEELARRLSEGQELGVIGDHVLVLAQDSEGGLPEVSLWPLGMPGKFEALGLKPGDRLVAVAGSPLGADLLSVATRLAETTNLAQIEITIEREGRRTPLQIQLQDDGGER